jgi:hypothetical protein
VVIYRIAPLAKGNDAIRFILCSLVFAVLLSLAHGRISRDTTLFALLGCAVGVCEFRRPWSSDVASISNQIKSRDSGGRVNPARW